MARATSTELTLRPATLDDADFVADVMTEVRPTSPTDPTILRYWWAHPVQSLETARFVVRRGGRDVGYGETGHAKWELNLKRYGAAVGDLLPSARSRESLDALFALLEERIIADGA